MAAVLRVLLDALRATATLLQPFMPGSMERMLDQLGVPPDRAQRSRPWGSRPVPAGQATAAATRRSFPGSPRRLKATVDA